MFPIVIKFYLLSFLFQSILSVDNNFVIYENEMPEEMKTLALTTVQLEINKKHDTSIISKKLVDTFNAEYGRHWFSIIGTSGVTTQIRHKPRTLLQFSYNDIHIVLFKPATLSQIEIISESRHNNAKIKISQNEMNEVMKNNAQIVSMIAIKSFNNFHQISQNISGSFNEKYGQQWNCIVGETDIDTNVEHIIGTFISLSIGEMEIIIYQTGSEKTQIKSDIDYIKSARNSLSEVQLIGSEMSEQMTNEVISVAKKMIMSVDSFGSLSKSISNHFVEKYGNVWVCSVADIMCTGINDWVKGTFFAAKIGGLQIEIFQSKFSEQKANNSSNFSDVIKKAKTSSVKINTATLSETDKANILSLATKSMELDFADCEQNPESWYDPYGQCYRKMGEYIIKSLGDFTDYGWCVTVGETNSHWNYCAGSYSDMSTFFQFNYANLHFNVIKYKSKTC